MDLNELQQNVLKHIEYKGKIRISRKKGASVSKISAFKRRDPDRLESDRLRILHTLNILQITPRTLENLTSLTVTILKPGSTPQYWLRPLAILLRLVDRYRRRIDRQTKLLRELLNDKPLGGYNRDYVLSGIDAERQSKESRFRRNTHLNLTEDDKRLAQLIDVHRRYPDRDPAQVSPAECSGCVADGIRHALRSWSPPAVVEHDSAWSEQQRRLDADELDRLADWFADSYGDLMSDGVEKLRGIASRVRRHSRSCE